MVPGHGPSRSCFWITGAARTPRCGKFLMREGRCVPLEIVVAAPRSEAPFWGAAEAEAARAPRNLRTQLDTGTQRLVLMAGRAPPRIVVVVGAG